MGENYKPDELLQQNCIIYGTLKHSKKVQTKLQSCP